MNGCFIEVTVLTGLTASFETFIIIDLSVLKILIEAVELASL